MRSLTRQKQWIWFTTVTEENNGIDTIEKYSSPIKKKMTVSATSGTPEEIKSGLVLNYDRYITSFDREFKPQEGDRVFVDRIPALDENGSIALDKDGVTPVVSPDYVVVKIIDTMKSNVSRFGIKRVDANE